MSFYHDKQIKGYLLFTICYAVLVLGVAAWLYQNQTASVKSMYLSHDTAIASSLLEQGVQEEVIATAISSTNANADGTEFLDSIGIRAQTLNALIPFFSTFQHRLSITLLFISIVFILILFAGTFLFLWIRNQLYRQAEIIINNYIINDYSCHLPQDCEGEIFKLFALVEQLATMLQSKNETEHKTKEFLKDTISDISHQIKTPIAALSMYQEIIESEPDNVETVKKFSTKTGIALKRIEQLIQSMLKITRLDTGNIVFEKRRCLVNEVIANAVNELTTRATNENKQIILEGNQEQFVVCDIDWTGEAISNLIKNALDHTESGGVIRITWENTPALLRIYISDNGNGIAPEDIHHIFKRFYRSKQSLDTPGIGLGLPLAKSIIEGQGGVISVESVINQGTTFILSFLTKP